MKCNCDIYLPKGSQVSPSCLQDISIFDGIRDEDFLKFIGIGIRRYFAENEPLFMQGDRVKEVFLIKAGRIKLCKITEEGLDITLDFRKPGDMVGEEALTRQFDHPVTALAMEEVMTCGFRLDDFNQLILENPELGLKIIGNMSKKIRSLTEQMSDTATGNLENRLLKKLSVIAREHGKKIHEGIAIDFLLTHEELGYLVGAHRVSITKALKTLREEGKLINMGRRFILPDPELVHPK